MRVLLAPYTVSLACWAIFEIGLLVRDVVRGAGGERRDRGTRALLSVSFGVSVVLSWTLPTRLPGLDLGAQRALAVAGLVAIWAGLVLRVWAVVTLGRFFRTFISVDEGQSVVSRGPYRWVRHPSYAGILMIVFGFGVGSGNALALAVSVVLPGAAIIRRVAVEESELVRGLGEPYRAYQRRTRRLVPGVW
jgi:protein-S-isoprenylcysteine O-methyltransferase Ste14